ncbi:pyridoxamine 5'-phosphate oxidase family protein [Paenibacillus sp. YYML68]|uniref:pyridoxamine 5'-phosphate oxidase family protein n=1 Tax=Paenibacillus sp. YYML68 TaxID=2909250 RepID=UPI00248F6D2E|nr:pyridoxamine 5'-phosphate oxidase family protein [Paenibacillus sp. YYML68]
MAETITALSEPMIEQLQKEALTLLNTIDHESGAPAMNAISWLYAKDATTLRFAVDQRSRIVANIQNNALVTLTYIGAGSVHAIYGKGELVAEALEDVPFKLACFDIHITEVRDAMFYGARISVEPEYEKTYDKRAAEKLDTQVFSAMKKA